jgi:hypothetical protein
LAVFATVFVLGVLWLIESIEPEPYVLFDLGITVPDAAGLKDSADEVCYEVKLPLQTQASTWYPAALGTRDGLRHGALSLVSKIGMDVFKEFRPRRSK